MKYQAICIILLIAISCQKNQIFITDNPSKIFYDYRMEKTQKKLNWCKTYWYSFQYTDEIKYLELAANYCKKAIESYFIIQHQLSFYIKQHYEAKIARKKTCFYYREIMYTAKYFQIYISKLPIYFCS